MDQIIRQIGRNGKAEGGYTLLFAVLVAALVLGVAVFILGISTKQYELSASARDSMYSFFAADSGIECVALNSSGGYLGTTNNVYATSTSDVIQCGNTSTSVAYEPTRYSPIQGISYPAYETYDTVSGGNPANSWFSLQFTDPYGNKTCAQITIIEYFDSSGYYHDVVQSRGYNHCTGTNGNSTLGPDLTNPNTVERALQLSHSTGS